MEDDEMMIADWQRILIGDAPWEFLLEVLFRTLIIYVALVIIMRMFGKRMNAQLTIVELAVMITLGAIAAIPMQAPARGIVPGLVLLISILLLQRGLSWLTFKKRRIEVITYGELKLLIKDGRMLIREMDKLRISKQQLFSVLRTKDIRHLGQVKRVYLEACGTFSLYEADDPKFGLSIMPEKEEELPLNKSKDRSKMACRRCGTVKEKKGEGKKNECPNCSANTWIEAVN